MTLELPEATTNVCTRSAQSAPPQPQGKGRGVDKRAAGEYQAEEAHDKLFLLLG